MYFYSVSNFYCFKQIRAIDFKKPTQIPKCTKFLVKAVTTDSKFVSVYNKYFIGIGVIKQYI